MAMQRPLFFAALLLSVVATGVAHADTVILKDGRTAAGRVSEEKNEVVVRQKHGEVRFAKDLVLRIERDDRWSELDRQQKQLGNGSADERYRLGVWCRDNAFPDEARAAFTSVLALDPDHQGARAALGYVRENGRWITLDDRMRGRGLVKLGDAWVTPAEKALADVLAEKRREDAIAKAKKAEEEKEARRKARADAERDARLARIRAYDEELARARARQQAEDEAEPRGFSSYSGFVTQRGAWGPYGPLLGGCGWGYGWAVPYPAYPYPSNGYRSVVRAYAPRIVRLGGGCGPVYGPTYYGWGGRSTWSGWGLGVGLSGSWTNRSGSLQLKFRSGF